MLDVDILLEEFHTMLDEHWRYEWGKHERGVVDCSGAIYYVLHKYGIPIYNGSNRIARVYISGKLIPYAEARQKGVISGGWVAFKHYKPNSAKYDLGAGYKPNGAYYNGDLNDYYHIGLVDEDTNWILNAQGAKTGFVRSRASENWSHVAPLKNIKYSGGIIMAEKTMTVIRTSDAASGSNTVNVRNNPSESSSKVLFTVKFGSVVTVYDTQGAWSQIGFSGKTGWMMTKFLTDMDSMVIPASVRASLSVIEAEMNKIFEAVGRG